MRGQDFWNDTRDEELRQRFKGCAEMTACEADRHLAQQMGCSIDTITRRRQKLKLRVASSFAFRPERTVHG